jgi:hypothetical protein
MDARTSSDTAMIASFIRYVARFAARVTALYEGQRLCSV